MNRSDRLSHACLPHAFTRFHPQNRTPTNYCIQCSRDGRQGGTERHGSTPRICKNQRSSCPPLLFPGHCTHKPSGPAGKHSLSHRPAQRPLDPSHLQQQCGRQWTRDRAGQNGSVENQYSSCPPLIFRGAVHTNPQGQQGSSRCLTVRLSDLSTRPICNAAASS